MPKSQAQPLGFFCQSRNPESRASLELFSKTFGPDFCLTRGLVTFTLILKIKPMDQSLKIQRFWALFSHVLDSIKRGVKDFEGEELEAARYFHEWLAREETPVLN